MNISSDFEYENRTRAMRSSQPTISAKRRWLTSERVALEVLESLGYKILEVRKKIVLNNVEVGEVDVVALDENSNTYAVEVKAGRIDVSGIRQAYVNAVLLNAKPLVVCKGFADDASKELAEKLGVEVIQLSDIFLIESEELNAVVKDVIEETLTEYLELFYGFNPNIKQEYLEVLEAIHSTTTIDEAAEKLGLDVPSLTKRLDELRRVGVIPKWAKKYSSIKRVAQIIIQRQNVTSALEESRRLVETIKEVYSQLRQFQSLLESLNQQLRKLAAQLTKSEKVEKNTSGIPQQLDQQSM